MALRSNDTSASEANWKLTSGAKRELREGILGINLSGARVHAFYIELFFSACQSVRPAKTGKRRCASVSVDKPGSSHALGARVPPIFTPSTRLSRSYPTAGRALPSLLCRPKSTGFSTEEQRGPPEGGRRRKRLRQRGPETSLFQAKGTSPWTQSSMTFTRPSRTRL